jgi:hypothetical protein
MNLRSIALTAFLALCGHSTRAELGYLGCPNCSVVVTMTKKAHALELMSHVSIISSMPLSGRILRSTPWSTEVEIGTWPSFAASSKVTSFQVAGVVSGMIEYNGAKSGWKVRSLVARMDFPQKDKKSAAVEEAGEALSVSNAGTIGHP